MTMTIHGILTTRKVMLETSLALLPALGVLCWYFGAAIITQVLLTVLTALMCEGLVAWLRGKSFASQALDGSGLLTAVLIAIAVPPALPWWMLVVGTAFAILVVKHIYGGLGHNIFNPAMMAYVMLIISFPVEMTSWAGLEVITRLPWSEQLLLAFHGGMSEGLTGATPLTDFRSSISSGSTAGQYFGSHNLGLFGMKHWEHINMAYLIGGGYLLARRLINYRIPLYLLLVFGGMASVFYLIDSSIYLSPAFHLFAGGSMLGAFFIATDPVTAASTNKGLIIYASGIGFLEFIIRTFGGYPDGIAFAVVIMNMFVPLINYLTRPREVERA
jgi:Na+-translocating ferredoxin:NAD+ oxidoreductase subunit D